MKTTVKAVVAVLLGSFALGAVADPTISDVVVRQRWPWSRLVDIEYALTCDDTQRVDVAVTARNGSTALALPNDTGSLSGDLYGVATGFRRIVWDPTRSAYTNDPLMLFQVELAPVPSHYMIIDLTKSLGEEGQITYRDDWGPWSEVTNAVYKSDKLVLRRIAAGSYKMGDTGVNVALTNDFYAGVFEVTQKQWYHIMDNTWPLSTQNVGTVVSAPVAYETYDHIRGATGDSPSVNWPNTGHLVSSDSFMGKLRSKTGLDTFDLPTEAQWEYACRAGTTTVFNDGDPAANVTGANSGTNSWLNAIGVYRCHPQYFDLGGSVNVGLLKPNRWGLYDTLGNIYEWCLNWTGTVSGGTEPVGPTGGTFRLLRGGSYRTYAYECTSTYRRQDTPPNSGDRSKGLRVFMVVP